MKYEHPFLFNPFHGILNERLIIYEAFKRGIKISKPIEGNRVFSSSGKNHIFNSHESGNVGRVPSKIANDKITCKKFFEIYGISTPKGKIFKKDEEDKALKFFKKLNKKIVCKPNNSTRSKLVYLEIKSEKEFKKAFKEITRNGYRVLVEEFVTGTEYRIFATEKGFVTAIKKDFPEIIGNGTNTIEQLINIRNSNHNLRFKNKEIKEKNEINLDKIDLKILKKNGLCLNQVLPKGEKIFLKINSGNICEGRESEVIENIHPSIKKIALKIIREILPGIKYLGIDILSKKSSLSEPHNSKDYSIIEVNCHASLTPFHFPDKGKPQNVAGAILDTIFPKNKTIKSQILLLKLNKKLFFYIFLLINFIKNNTTKPNP